MCPRDDGGDGDLDNGRARLGEMVSEVTIYSQGWIWWHKSSIHDVKVMMENNRGLRWVWWNISCSSNKRSTGSGLKYSLSQGFSWREKGVHLEVSNDHPFDQELEDEGIQCGSSEMCIRCARVAIWEGFIWKVFETSQLSRNNWEGN